MPKKSHERPDCRTYSNNQLRCSQEGINTQNITKSLVANRSVLAPLRSEWSRLVHTAALARQVARDQLATGQFIPGVNATCTHHKEPCIYVSFPELEIGKIMMEENKREGTNVEARQPY